MPVCPVAYSSDEPEPLADQSQSCPPAERRPYITPGLHRGQSGLHSSPSITTMLSKLCVGLPNTQFHVLAPGQSVSQGPSPLGELAWHTFVVQHTTCIDTAQEPFPDDGTDSVGISAQVI
jgi:hypothetical protein